MGRKHDLCRSGADCGTSCLVDSDLDGGMLESVGTRPLAPTNLTGQAGRSSVTLNWTDNSTNQTGFYIERAPSGTTSFARVGTVGASTKTFTNTVSKGTYVYRVQAFNASSVSAYSNTVTVRVAK